MKKRFSAWLLALCCHLPAQATWFEVTGQADLLESNLAARNNALKDAVFQAMQYSGADLSTFNYMQPILEQERDQYLFSDSEVREIQVVDVKRGGGKYYVTARIDIYPTAKTCHKTQYKKAVLISQFGMQTPQHAALGGIYQLGDDFSEVLNRQINRQSQSFISPAVTRVDVNPKFPQAATMLAQDNDAQYIVVGNLTDLSATIEKRTLSKDRTSRQFAAFMQVLDGNNGEVVFQQDYRDIAEWPFERTSQVDTKTARFWQSSYGQMVLRLSRQMMLDLENQLACRASLPEVVNAHNSMAQVNVGRIHGVRSGDLLMLWHRAAFVDQSGIPRSRMVKSDIRLTVDRVYESSAEVIVKQPELAGSIQVGDVVTKVVSGK
ncbi:flagellar assembly protein FlgT [Thaumasiovibrio subtropicus]|uniref:flagellar assembly protein FlgT n=1 Tax=Thaumasiovibrio subtropicus TaxID=1891207 RepID=UPI000B35D35D|nr:flagellar assembly protein FlgT [Thaumasiovibrio subtropicus]